MQWIEIIHVRAYSEAFRERALREVREISLADFPETLEDISCWPRYDLPTDLGIVLRWEDNPEGQIRSAVGLRLAENFSRFGWISHSVWTTSDKIGKRGEADVASTTGRYPEQM